jgi:hypothetical protein
MAAKDSRPPARSTNRFDDVKFGGKRPNQGGDVTPKALGEESHLPRRKVAAACYETLPGGA